MSVLSIVHNAEAAVPQLRNVAACLRTIADDIEAGKYGECLRAAVVLRCSQMEPVIFGPGDTTPAQTFMDFHAGAQQLMAMQRPERG